MSYLFLKISSIMIWSSYHINSRLWRFDKDSLQSSHLLKWFRKLDVKIRSLVWNQKAFLMNLVLEDQGDWGTSWESLDLKSNRSQKTSWVLKVGIIQASYGSKSHTKGFFCSQMLIFYINLLSSHLRPLHSLFKINFPDQMTVVVVFFVTKKATEL